MTLFPLRAPTICPATCASLQPHPLNRASPSVRPLKVRSHEAAVPQRSAQALVTEEPPHLVESRAATQPARRGEVTQRVGVQASVGGQAGLSTQAVENLYQVPTLQGPAHAVAVAEQESLR